MLRKRWEISVRRGRLEDLAVERVDAVDKPATGRSWLITKSKDRRRAAASRQVDEALVSALEPVVRRVLTQGRFASEAARRFSVRKGVKPETVEARYGLSFGRELGGEGTVAALVVGDAIDGSERTVAVESGADSATLEKGLTRLGKGLFAGPVFAKPINAVTGKRG